MTFSSHPCDHTDPRVQQGIFLLTSTDELRKDTVELLKSNG